MGRSWVAPSECLSQRTWRSSQVPVGREAVFGGEDSVSRPFLGAPCLSDLRKFPEKVLSRLTLGSLTCECRIESPGQTRRRIQRYTYDTLGAACIFPTTSSLRSVTATDGGGGVIRRLLGVDVVADVKTRVLQIGHAAPCAPTR